MVFKTKKKPHLFDAKAMAMIFSSSALEVKDNSQGYHPWN